MRTARGVALHALARIREGAYANLVLPPLLTRSGLDDRDRRFVTDLVYGTTRMQRACDFLVDRFLFRDVDPEVRDVLRLGAYQLAFLDTPPHAAVSATVAEAGGRTRGLVNAVLRKVAAAPVEWPDEATRLSYPDWIVERLVADLGREDAIGALQQMNVPPTVHTRPDGYVQDPASQEVAAYVAAGAARGERVLDICAAPGGKATALATSSGLVVAVDLHPHRASLVAENARSTGTEATVVALAADGRRAPLRPHAFDRVLVDAPCSGLGSLRRRPDARWRIQPSDVEDLAKLQGELVAAAFDLVRPGGIVVYAACTLTAAEGPQLTDAILAAEPGASVLPAPGDPWRAWGQGAVLLPQAAGTDGMYVLGLRAASG
jgi:16S rRNA (cytosine967-C5)-methyltransferase